MDAKMTKVEEKIIEMNRNLNFLEEEKKILKNQAKELSFELRDSLEREKICHVDINEIKNELQNFKIENHESRDIENIELINLNDAYGILKTDHEIMKNDMNALKAYLDSAKSEVSVLKSELDSVNLEISVLKSEQESTVVEMSGLKHDGNELHIKINNDVEIHHQNETSLKNVNLDLSNTNEINKEKYENDIIVLEERISDYDKNHMIYLSQIDDLKVEITNFENRNELQINMIKELEEKNIDILKSFDENTNNETVLLKNNLDIIQIEKLDMLSKMKELEDTIIVLNASIEQLEERKVLSIQVD
jgi:chromosome segregation ATPase